MNLDDFKHDVKRVKAPPGASGGSGHSIVDRLRAFDAEERRRHLGGMVILAALGVAYVATGAGGREFLGVAMLLIALYFGLTARRFAQVRYDEPPREFLARAARRHQWWRWYDVLAAIPLLALLFRGGMRVVTEMAERHLGPEGVRLAQLGYVAFFALVVGCGLVFGRAEWRRRNGPLLDEIARLRVDLGDVEPGGDARS